MRCAGALLVRGGQVLIARRHPDRAWYPGVWDVVGGHLEGAETPIEAAKRELGEELGIDVEAVDLALLDTIWGPDYELAVFATGTWRGRPCNLAPHEHDRLGWFAPDDIDHLEVADARLAELARQAIDLVGGSPG